MEIQHREIQMDYLGQTKENSNVCVLQESRQSQVLMDSIMEHSSHINYLPMMDFL
jgi:hypothetical protein